MEDKTTEDQIVRRTESRKRLRRLQIMTVPVIGMLWLGAWLTTRTLGGGYEADAFWGVLAILKPAALYGMPLLGALNILMLQIGIKRIDDDKKKG